MDGTLCSKSGYNWLRTVGVVLQTNPHTNTGQWIIVRIPVWVLCDWRVALFLAVPVVKWIWLAASDTASGLRRHQLKVSATAWDFSHLQWPRNSKPCHGRNWIDVQTLCSDFLAASCGCFTWSYIITVTASFLAALRWLTASGCPCVDGYQVCLQPSSSRQIRLKLRQALSLWLASTNQFHLPLRF